MAVIVFSGGHTLKVSGSKEQWREHLTVPSVGNIEGGWVTVPSGDSEAVVNPHQVAYIADDADAPQAESAPSPFYTEDAKRAGGFQ